MSGHENISVVSLSSMIVLKAHSSEWSNPSVGWWLFGLAHKIKCRLWLQIFIRVISLLARNFQSSTEVHLSWKSIEFKFKLVSKLHQMSSVRGPKITGHKLWFSYLLEKKKGRCFVSSWWDKILLWRVENFSKQKMLLTCCSLFFTPEKSYARTRQRTPKIVDGSFLHLSLVCFPSQPVSCGALKQLMTWFWEILQHGPWANTRFMHHFRELQSSTWKTRSRSQRWQTQKSYTADSFAQRARSFSCFFFHTHSSALKVASVHELCETKVQTVDKGFRSSVHIWTVCSAHMDTFQTPNTCILMHAPPQKENTPLQS